ncbi:MBL fold metallo-hydrolase [Acinetobacter baumannii]|uniref:MBL fold metallo-hydrolase n=1 Tax=Acinetobacter baumannii TaxID=470 RepID=UPI000DE72E0E|nr:MBL fold metallo-hydrolase [Acinetobacter baumannii]MBJ9579003.1 MBL fold metallo-hydrolase [Acinetobacter baumannii]MDC5579589.1 MBL fold metallo-hydrolase [Acinetobacter baumannii]SSS46254.1 Beta-lactamase-like protein [Acinetobacter baumannii]
MQFTIESFKSLDNYEIAVVESGRDVFLNYMFILYDKKTNDAVIVDPGWDAKYLIGYINNHGLKCRGILITHTHADHVHEAAEVSSVLNCPIHMSSREANVSEYKHPNLETFSTNTEILCGSVRCFALLTPGHTSGTSCFLVGDKLFTGDTLFIEGCGLCSGPDGSVEQMYQSIQFLRSVIPDNVLVYPGHMYKEQLAKPFSYLKQHNFYLKMTDQKIFEAFCSRKVRNQKIPPKYGTAKALDTKIVVF